MATFYSIDRANDRIANLSEMLALLRQQRDELRELKADYEASNPGEDQRRIRLKMQGLVDQMQATVARIDGRDRPGRGPAQGLSAATRDRPSRSPDGGAGGLRPARLLPRA